MPCYWRLWPPKPTTTRSSDSPVTAPSTIRTGATRSRKRRPVSAEPTDSADAEPHVNLANDVVGADQAQTERARFSVVEAHAELTPHQQSSPKRRDAHRFCLHSERLCHLGRSGRVEHAQRKRDAKRLWQGVDRVF